MVKKALLVVAIAICSSPAAADWQKIQKEKSCSSLAEEMSSNVELANHINKRIVDLRKEEREASLENESDKKLEKAMLRPERMENLKNENRREMAEMGIIWMSYCKG